MAEEDCSGHLREGRYTLAPLLDHAAVVVCMAYVELNLVRARVIAQQRHRTVTRVQAMVAAGETTAEKAAATIRAYLPCCHVLT